MSSIISFIFVIVPALIIIWFMVSVVSSLREQNSLLQELIKTLKNKEE